MKRLVVVTVLAAMSVSCVGEGGDAFIRILGAHALKSQDDGLCTLTDTSIGSGLLDISGGRSYMLGTNVETTISQAPPIEVEDRAFPRAGTHDTIIDEAVFAYESDVALALPAEERIPMYFLFRSNTSEASQLVFSIIGPEALGVLQSSVGVGQQVTLFVKIRLEGRLAGSTSISRISSNTITFPIVVINSGYSAAAGCPVGKTPKAVDPAQIPCGQAGQDAAAPICI